MSAALNKKDVFWTSLISTFIGAVFTIVGLFFTAQYSSHLQAKDWQREKTFVAQKDLLDRRMTLLERQIQISRKGHLISSLQLRNDLAMEEIQKHLKLRRTPEIERKLKDNSEVINQFATHRSEYLTVLTMASSLFGPATRKAIEEQLAASNPKVWEASDQLSEKVSLAMSSELTHGLSNVPAKTSKSELALPK